MHTFWFTSTAVKYFGSSGSITWVRQAWPTRNMKAAANATDIFGKHWIAFKSAARIIFTISLFASTTRCARRITPILHALLGGVERTAGRTPNCRIGGKQPPRRRCAAATFPCVASHHLPQRSLECTLSKPRLQIEITVRLTFITDRRHTLGKSVGS